MGKTHVGTWISLVNVDDGVVFAKPREIAEAEEEEARRKEIARRDMQARKEEAFRKAQVLREKQTHCEEELDRRIREIRARIEGQIRREERVHEDRTCNECGRVFISVAAKDQHYNDTHLRNDSCTCSICNRAFSTPQ